MQSVEKWLENSSRMWYKVDNKVCEDKFEKEREKMTNSEQLTYCTTKITSIYEDGKVATGTGFFMDFNINEEERTCQSVIITNKHVVNGAKTIIYSVCRGDLNNNPLDQEKFTITMNSFNIINHPDNLVDLCAISIATAESQTKSNDIHLYRGKFGTDLIITDKEINECATMEDIIMVGYPNGLEDNYNNKPIIRRGVTSTHMKFNYNGKKEFLIAMACFPGSSGSPVFFCNDGYYATNKGLTVGSRVKLLGVLYAGPQHTGIGNIVFENISTNPKAIFNIPNNLGLVIKA